MKLSQGVPSNFHGALICLAACLAVVVWCSPSLSQVITRQPSLHQGTATSIVITWRTSPASEGRLRYGTAPDRLDRFVDASVVNLHHEVRVEDLQPDTRYYYSVGTPTQVLAGGDAAHFFKTSPPLGARTRFRTWVVGDSGTGGSAQASVRDAMTAYVGATPPDLFVHVGDMAYSNGTDDEFQSRFFDPYASILTHTVIWPAIGNHEGRSSDSGGQTGPYYDSYALPTQGEAGGLASGTEAYYAFDYANAHFVVLDSHDSPRGVDGAMLQWLEQDLSSTSQEWLIAYWHHPPYSKGSHDSDVEGALIEMRENALPILEAAGVDLVLAGHSHVYERSFLLDGAYDTPTRDLSHIVDGGDGRIGGDGPYIKASGLNPNEGAVYVVAGHGGAGTSSVGEHPMMVVSEVANGSCLIDIEGSALTLRNLRWDGVVSDAFTIAKGDALLIETPRSGEQLLRDSTHMIRWVTIGEIPRVKLEYSTDGGEQWQLISASEVNSGSFSWRVPTLTTDRALVRVSDVSREGVSGVSDGPFSIGRDITQEVIGWGDIWRYNDQGQALDDTWLTSAYDDSAWPSGPAQLGYGDGDEATVLRDTDPNISSYYFRQRVELEGELTEAVFNAIHDDGIAIWVNGALVFSKYVDDGLAFDTFATSTSSDNEPASAVIPLSPSNPFVTGENLIAVMVKQRSASSSDLSFDLQLSVTLSFNASPRLEPIPNRQIVVGDSLTLTLEASDADGDQLSFSAAVLPTGSELDQAEGIFRWTPLPGQEGSYPVTFAVSDGQSEDTQPVIFVVTDATAAIPELEPLADQSVLEGSRLKVDVVANIEALDTLSLSAYDLPQGGTFEPSTGIFDWTPGYEQSGLYRVTFVASDGVLDARETLQITVVNVNRAPTFEPVSLQRVVAGEALSLKVEATDPDGDPLSFEYEGPAGASLDGDRLSWQTSEADLGRHSLTVKASDGALVSSQVVLVDVTSGGGPNTRGSSEQGEQSGCGCHIKAQPYSPPWSVGLLWGSLLGLLIVRVQRFRS